MRNIVSFICIILIFVSLGKVDFVSSDEVTSDDPSGVQEKESNTLPSGILRSQRIYHFNLMKDLHYFPS